MCTNILISNYIHWLTPQRCHLMASHVLQNVYYVQVNIRSSGPVRLPKLDICRTCSNDKKTTPAGRERECQDHQRKMSHVAEETTRERQEQKNLTKRLQQQGQAKREKDSMRE